MQKAQMTYETRTDADIKRAFLTLLSRKPLADITITELAREAKVSRSTFYAHFNNLSDVYESLVEEFDDSTAPMLPHLQCLESGVCEEEQLFCTLLRESTRYRPIISEDRFLASYLSSSNSVAKHDMYAVLTEAGYTDAQAQALCKFQLSGCFSAALESRVGDEEWRAIRMAIDTFVKGGIRACLKAKVR